jgi:hypothetical protein
MAHTPGPWRADHEGGLIVLNGSHAYSIRDICSDDRGWNAEDLDLLAAAPELLAALKRAISLLSYASQDGGIYGCNADEWFGMEASCRAAIAKAEGRTDD